MKTGNIPKNLTFFVKEPQSVYWRWDDVDNAPEKQFTVNPCYISDSENKKTLKTGEEWHKSYRYEYVNKQHTRIDSVKHFQFTVPNVPFRNLRIITLEIRDQGGRAYKVCADIGGHKNLYFDMREDVLLDIIFENGIDKGGIINAEFIFARVNASMKAIRVGSALHAKMIEATTYHDVKPLDKLEVGGIYESKTGKSVYLGEFYTRDLKFKSSPVDSRYMRHRNLTGTEEIINGYYIDVDELTRADKCYVFCKIYEHAPDKLHDFAISIVKTHSYKKKAGTMTIPENFVMEMKDRVMKTERFFVHPKIFNLSETRGYVHPSMKKYVK